ncbi:lytic polysaccharide monooxygenase [Periconia macrospinosa]|uniref:AA9 family lytic polysaccharide monooxygenase n=1 Tax=Periconia macrospinosa TaxID=97972 RepID=A0A2V1DR42_9PLEO|nr:lytic polysaccharide monooxygenase [Periconia macrospinosa]
MQSLRSVAWLLAIIPQALSHGGGMLYTIDGVEHTGTHASVLNKVTGSIQRVWTWDGINEVSNDHLACRHSGEPYDISYHAPTKAGSTINVNYTDPLRFNPPWSFGHGYGPMMAYMAACPDSGCETVNLTAPIWFKIWEAGLLSGTWTTGHWAMADVMNGATLNIPTPKNLKKGKYILRHEMISIETGQMQIFPNCIHLDVRGDGSSVPKKDELVSFPGTYDGYAGVSWEMEGQGSEWFWVVHQYDTFYTIPGPEVWKG